MPGSVGRAKFGTMQLQDLKIIVTGGAQGMGAYFVKQLAQAGAQVAVGDVLKEPLDALSQDTASLAGGVFVRTVDVSDPGQCESFVDWAADRMGGLNGLINNAGILRDGLLVKKDRETGKVVKLSNEQWQKVIDVNLTGATFMVRDAVAKMVELGASRGAPGAASTAGVVVNMSSIARHGNRGQTNYVSAKSALAANTVTWSREFAKFGVRVGAVAPGMIETPMTAGMNQKARDALVNLVPVGRVGVPEDIWLAVKFVIECDYFNGRTIDVDGGLNL